MNSENVDTSSGHYRCKLCGFWSTHPLDKHECLRQGSALRPGPAPLTAGIVADNYKVPMFERELKAAGFTYRKLPFNKNSTLIQVDYVKEQHEQIKALCIKVNSAEVHRKAKEN